MRAVGKFILGAAVGALVGSAIAIILAPVSGNEMRTRIYDYCTNIRNDMKSAAEMKRQQLREELLARQSRI